jgi:hypothetical protein
MNVEVIAMPHHPVSVSQGYLRTRSVPLRKGRPSFPKNEGEGSRSAGGNDAKASEQYVKSGGVETAATNAAAALDGPEGIALREAEVAASGTEIAEDERPTLPRVAERQSDGFQEPDDMKDPSEDRE